VGNFQAQALFESKPLSFNWTRELAMKKKRMRYLPDSGASATGFRQPLAGFSLLEVIIATALATVLLGSVWSLFQILTKRQAIELRQAESNQLIRSLHQRLTRDLNNLPAIDRPPAAPHLAAFEQDALPDGQLFWPFSLLDPQPSGVSTRRATVLRGDQSTLTLAQFIEPVEWEEITDSDDPAGHRSLESKTLPLIKEVVYQLPRWPVPDDEWSRETVESSSESLKDDGEDSLLPKLVREERLSSLSPGGIQSSARSVRTDDDELVDAKPNRSHPRNQRDGNRDEDHKEEVHVPVQRETLEDISVAAFAYFDGSHWRTEWDTELEQRLPVAIRFRWRQAAIPKSESGEAAKNFSNLLPPAELHRQKSAGQSALNEPGRLEFNRAPSVESPESSWYEGEWIFLLQPATQSAGSSAESQLGFEGRSRSGCLPMMDSGLRTVGDHHG
jgi:type II secretory pathway pseudopilin PulG